MTYFVKTDGLSERIVGLSGAANVQFGEDERSDEARIRVTANAALRTIGTAALPGTYETITAKGCRLSAIGRGKGS